MIKFLNIFIEGKDDPQDLSGKSTFWDSISTDFQEESASTARNLLIENNIPFSEKRLKQYTVKSLCREITSKLGCEAYEVWETNNRLLSAGIPNELRFKHLIAKYLGR